jgi:uncharacterized protein YggE
MNIGRRLKAVGIGALVAAAVGASMVGFGSGVSAQDASPVTNQYPATISVSGDGTVLVSPDAATISIGVNVVNADIVQAQTQAETQIEAVLAALKAAGIDDKDIQTSNYSVNLIQNYDSNGMPGEITGYQVNNQLNVTVRKLDKLGEVLQAAIAQGANSIYGINFIVTDSTKAASQARKMVVADATKKAQELADAAGGKLGRVLSISENSGPTPYPPMYGGAGAAADSAKAVSISGGSNIIQVSVQMVFELVQ